MSCAPPSNANQWYGWRRSGGVLGLGSALATFTQSLVGHRTPRAGYRGKLKCGRLWRTTGNNNIDKDE